MSTVCAACIVVMSSRLFTRPAIAVSGASDCRQRDGGRVMRRRGCARFVARGSWPTAGNGQRAIVGRPASGRRPSGEEGHVNMKERACRTPK